MSESLGNKITTEIDYKAEVLKKHPEAKLEVSQVGYAVGHKEYRIKLDTAGARARYLAAMVAFSEDDAWKYAYEVIEKEQPAPIKVEHVDKLPTFDNVVAEHIEAQKSK